MTYAVFAGCCAHCPPYLWRLSGGHRRLTFDTQPQRHPLTLSPRCTHGDTPPARAAAAAAAAPFPRSPSAAAGHAAGLGPQGPRGLPARRRQALPLPSSRRRRRRRRLRRQLLPLLRSDSEASGSQHPAASMSPASVSPRTLSGGGSSSSGGGGGDDGGGCLSLSPGLCRQRVCRSLRVHYEHTTLVSCHRPLRCAGMPGPSSAASAEQSPEY